ncbi:hypothetical protein [Methylosinus sp. PW1]|uniref:hypothetical protein n=1 Tax=Methylosinus sp. PW1 TaxID=107636 RepID=UPI0012EB506C|nr:hypothetical protein [Methylosinus sp. PW1]
MSKTETLTIAAIEDSVPALVEARAAVAAFQAMIRKKAGDDLDSWIDRAKPGLLASFASGVTKDRATVVAAITNVCAPRSTRTVTPSTSSSIVGAESISARRARRLRFTGDAALALA